MLQKIIHGIPYCLIVLIILLSVLWGNQAVTAMAENKPVPRQNCIVIDPGHGGVDGGAISVTGKPESSFNLEISLRLNDLLHLLGYQTKMIRKEDISVYTSGNTIAQKKVSDLKERLRIIEDTAHPILLSIHQNIFSQERYRGAQVFYADTTGSADLAKELQNLFIQTLNKGSNRTCRRSKGVYIMEHIRCPGVLIECGFLSNIQEEALLRTSEYQKKLCCIIASSLSRFLSNT